MDAVTQNKGTWVSLHGLRLKLSYGLSRYYPRDYEKDNFEFLSSVELKEGYCIDVGAHLGLYSMWLAKMKGKNILAFEPTPSVYEKCKSLVKLNNLSSNIQVYRKAVAGENGTAVFTLYKTRNGEDDQTRFAEANSLENFDHAHGAGFETTEVECVTIDSINNNQTQPVCLIKIDAEGSEATILGGAVNTFKTDRPVAIMSLHVFMYKNPEQVLSGIYDFFGTKNYRVLYQAKPINKKELLALQNLEIFDIQLLPGESA
jgi:FkbM family methyltransferase